MKMGRVRQVNPTYVRDLLVDLAQYSSALASPVESKPRKIPDLLTYEENSSCVKFKATYPIMTDDFGRAAIYLRAHPLHGVHLTPTGTNGASYIQGSRGLFPIAQSGIGPYGQPVPGAAPPYALTAGTSGYMQAVFIGPLATNASLPYGDLQIVTAALAQASAARVTAFGANIEGLIGAVINQQGSVAVRYDKTSTLHPDVSIPLLVIPPVGGGVAYHNNNLINYVNAAQAVGVDPRPIINGPIDAFGVPISGAEDWHPCSGTAYSRAPPAGVDLQFLDYFSSTTDAEQTTMLAICVGGGIITDVEYRAMVAASSGAWETITIVLDGCQPSAHVCDLTVAMHMELIPLTKAVEYGESLQSVTPMVGGMAYAAPAAKSVRDANATGSWKSALKKAVSIGGDIVKVFAPGAASGVVDLIQKGVNRL